MKKNSTNNKNSFIDYVQLATNLATLIDTLTVRLVKIEKATNAISEWNQEKAWKASAAKQTKRCISDLRRLHKVIGSCFFCQIAKTKS